VQRCFVHFSPRLARRGGSGTCQRGISCCSPGSPRRPPILPCARGPGAATVTFTAPRSTASNNITVLTVSS
jgi:hypothetical protein